MLRPLLLALAVLLPTVGYSCPNLSGNFFNPSYSYQLQQTGCEKVNFRRAVAGSQFSEFIAETGKTTSYAWKASPDIVRVDESWSWNQAALELTQSMVSSSGQTKLKFVLSYSVNTDGLVETLQSFSLVEGVFVANGSPTTRNFKRVR